MKHALRTSLAIVVVAFAAGAASTSNVEAADSVGSPVAFKLCPAEGEDAVVKCQVIGDPASYLVPTGRLLTIEQVSGDCGGDGEPGEALRISIKTQTGGVSVPHWIIGVPFETNASGGLIPLTLTRIYADPNSSVTIGLGFVPSVSGAFCRLSFSGTLTKP
jgi:hypothetical protein